jgi:hypothetical protein
LFAAFAVKMRCQGTGAVLLFETQKQADVALFAGFLY